MHRPRHDPSWLLSLYVQTRARLVLYASQWMGSGAAEDAVQKVFVVLYLSGDRPTNPKAWLYTAVRRAAISEARSRSSRRKHEAASGSLNLLFEQPPTALVNREAVTAALAVLDFEEREIVTLRVWSELTLNEIAGVTGLSTPTVFRKYRAALAKVKEKLEAVCKTTKN